MRLIYYYIVFWFYQDSFRFPYGPSWSVIVTCYRQIDEQQYLETLSKFCHTQNRTPVLKLDGIYIGLTHYSAKKRAFYDNYTQP